MPTFQNDPVQSKTDSTSPAVIAENTNTTPQAGVGVHAKSAAAGVVGESTTWHGVAGLSESTTGGQGVFGGAVGTGVAGVSKTWLGVYGETNAPANAGAAGVWGEGKAGGDGVKGQASGQGKAAVAGFHLTNQGYGVFGQGSPGVNGFSHAGTGVVGASDQETGVHGRGVTGGLFEGSAAGITAKGGGDARDLAGFFNGNVEVIKTVKTFDVFITGSDCAEDFDVTSSAHIEPGTVMVIGDDARLVESRRAYDKRVAGIISGAADYKPGIVLGKDVSRKDRVPLALIGKVFCKVDATYAPIKVGDLLTTSHTEGHAMKAEDPLKAFGAVVGKALAPLSEGRSLLPILVALQ